MTGGAYHSGDLAYRDEAGFVYFAGRLGDWMRVDGENLGTAPIERVLMRYPDVTEVAVYGIPDSCRRPGDGGAGRARTAAEFDPAAFARFSPRKTISGPNSGRPSCGSPGTAPDRDLQGDQAPSRRRGAGLRRPGFRDPPLGSAAAQVRQRCEAGLKFTAIAVVVVSVSAWLSAPMGAPSAAAAPCPDVDVVFARGTDEPPGVGVVGQTFIDAFRSDVAGAEDRRRLPGELSGQPGLSDRHRRGGRRRQPCPRCGCQLPRHQDRVGRLLPGRGRHRPADIGRHHRRFDPAAGAARSAATPSGRPGCRRGPVRKALNRSAELTRHAPAHRRSAVRGQDHRPVRRRRPDLLQGPGQQHRPAPACTG